MKTFIVVATIYHAVVGQTNSAPVETANGTKINVQTIEQDRICALSRDLLKRWGGTFDYGDKILVNGTGEMDGIWHVHDTMNERFTNCIDFLVPEYRKGGKWQDVTIRRI